MLNLTTTEMINKQGATEIQQPSHVHVIMQGTSGACLTTEAVVSVETV